MSEVLAGRQFYAPQILPALQLALGIGVSRMLQDESPTNITAVYAVRRAIAAVDAQAEKDALPYATPVNQREGMPLWQLAASALGPFASEARVIASVATSTAVYRDGPSGKWLMPALVVGTGALLYLGYRWAR